jgi:hypothetical protein
MSAYTDDHTVDPNTDTAVVTIVITVGPVR